MYGHTQNIFAALSSSDISEDNVEQILAENTAKDIFDAAMILTGMFVQKIANDIQPIAPNRANAWAEIAEAVRNFTPHPHVRPDALPAIAMVLDNRAVEDREYYMRRLTELVAASERGEEVVDDIQATLDVLA